MSRIGRHEWGFRAATGLFGLVVVGLVVAIGFELTRQSTLSIQKFGLSFWRTQTWDPVAGDFGALPFIWGTLYSSILALVLATPVAIGIAVFIAELCPARLRQPSRPSSRVSASSRKSDASFVWTSVSTRSATISLGSPWTYSSHMRTAPLPLWTSIGSGSQARQAATSA